MATAQSQRAAATETGHGNRVSGSAVPHEQVPAAELRSFLKETRRFQTWTEETLAKTLNIRLAQAKEAMAVLQLQGYIEPAGNTGEWRVTQEGDLVSGAKAPRFTRQSMENALAGLRDRIKAVNDDSDAPYRITEAVAFGDFLGDAQRVQAADVGIRLVPRTQGQSIASAKEQAAEINFLKQLRGKTALLHIVAYEEWMSSRSHSQLL
jgi:hypothetical protein